MNAGLGNEGSAGPAPSQVFLGLLAAIAKPSFDKTKDQWGEVLSKVDEQSISNISLASLPGLTARTGDERAELIRSLLRFVRGEQTPNKITELANNLHQYLTDLSLPVEIDVDILTWMILIQTIILLMYENPFQLASLFEDIPQDPAEAGHLVLKGGLPGVCLYEVLRQLLPALLKTGKSPQAARRQMPPIVRSELRQQQFAEQLMLWDHRLSWDPVPVNYVFTFSGLSAVGLDPTTLASFPDPFKQGMAARAERLGDTGPSAPKNWHGHLGLNNTGDSESIHGYFTSGFLVGDEKTPGSALLWQKLRDDVAAFNERSTQKGEGLKSFSIFFFVGLAWRSLISRSAKTPTNLVRSTLSSTRLTVGSTSDLWTA